MIEMYRVVVQGNLAKVSSVSKYSTSLNQRATRGTIKEFSRQSRKRMLDRLASLNREAIRFNKDRVKFITLTYERRIVPLARAKRDLKVFIERLQERFPECWVVWRMEFQERTTVHFHLMVGNAGFWWLHAKQHKEGKLGMVDAWNEITGQSAKNSLDFETIHSFNGVMYYVSKYMAKPAEDAIPDGDFIHSSKGEDGTTRHIEVSPDGEILGDGFMGLSIAHILSVKNLPKELPKTDLWKIGRFWGVCGRKNLPVAERREYTFYAHPAVRAYATALIPSLHAQPERGFTIYHESPESVLSGFMDYLEDATCHISEHDHRERCVASWRMFHSTPTAMQLKAIAREKEQTRQRVKTAFGFDYLDSYANS